MTYQDPQDGNMQTWMDKLGARAVLRSAAFAACVCGAAWALVGCGDTSCPAPEQPSETNLPAAEIDWSSDAEGATDATGVLLGRGGTTTLELHCARDCPLVRAEVSRARVVRVVEHDGQRVVLEGVEPGHARVFLVTEGGETYPVRVEVAERARSVMELPTSQAPGFFKRATVPLSSGRTLSDAAMLPNTSMILALRHEDADGRTLAGRGLGGALTLEGGEAEGVMLRGIDATGEPLAQRSNLYVLESGGELTQAALKLGDATVMGLEVIDAADVASTRGVIFDLTGAWWTSFEDGDIVAIDRVGGLVLYLDASTADGRPVLGEGDRPMQVTPNLEGGLQAEGWRLLFLLAELPEGVTSIRFDWIQSASVSLDHVPVVFEEP